MLTLTSTRSTKNKITVDQFHHAKEYLTISVNIYLVGTNECGKTTATIITTVVKQLQVPRMSQPLLIQALKHLFGRLKSFCKLISIATSSIRLRTWLPPTTRPFPLLKVSVQYHRGDNLRSWYNLMPRHHLRL